MITLILSIFILLIGYFVYSKYIERVFGADGNRPTPAVTMTDGVDYIPMPWWRVFLIQFLNIAGRLDTWKTRQRTIVDSLDELEETLAERKHQSITVTPKGTQTYIVLREQTFKGRSGRSIKD